MKHIYPNYKVVLLCSNQCGQATALVASIFFIHPWQHDENEEKVYLTQNYNMPLSAG